MAITMSGADLMQALCLFYGHGSSRAVRQRINARKVVFPDDL